MQSVYCELLQGEDWVSFISISWHKISAQLMFEWINDKARETGREHKNQKHITQKKQSRKTEDSRLALKTVNAFNNFLKELMCGQIN